MASRKASTDCTGQSCAALAQAVEVASAVQYVPIDAAAYCGSSTDRFLPCNPCWEAWNKAFPGFVQAIEIVSGRHPKAEKKTASGDLIDLCQRCFSMVRFVKPGAKKVRIMPCPRCRPSVTEECGGCGRPVFNPEDFSVPKHLHHLLRCNGCHPGCVYCGGTHSHDNLCELAKMDINTRGGIAAGTILQKDYDFNLTSHPRAGDLNPSKVTKVKPQEPFHFFLHRSFSTETNNAWCQRMVGTLTELLRELIEGIVLFGPIGMVFPGNKVNWLTLLRGSLPRERANMMETWRRLDNIMTDVVTYPPNSMPPNAWRAVVSNFSPAICAPFVYVGGDPPMGKSRHALFDIIVNQLTRHVTPGGEAERQETAVDAAMDQRERRVREVMAQQGADANAEGFPWRLFEGQAGRRQARADRAPQEEGRFRVETGARDVMERGRNPGGNVPPDFIVQRIEARGNDAPPPEQPEQPEEPGRAERQLRTLEEVLNHEGREPRDDNPVRGGDL